MKQAAMTNLFNILGMLFLRVVQEANLLVTFGPSYVVTRFVMGKVVAGASLLLAYVPVHRA